MPNFNGAIVVHTLQLIKTPATLREIVVTIAKNIDLPEDELMKPVKQTLDMGNRLGFFQKLNGRYFMVPLTFESLMSEVKSMEQSVQRIDKCDKINAKPKPEKRTFKKPTAKQQFMPNKRLEFLNQYPSLMGPESTTTLMPKESVHGKFKGFVQPKPKRFQQQQQQPAK